MSRALAALRGVFCRLFPITSTLALGHSLNSAHPLRMLGVREFEPVDAVFSRAAL